MEFRRCCTKMSWHMEAHRTGGHNVPRKCGYSIHPSAWWTLAREVRVGTPRWRPAARRAEASSQAVKARGIPEAVNETEILKGMDAEKSAIEVAVVILTKTARRKKAEVAAVTATKTARRRKMAVAAEIATKTARRTKIAVVAAIVTKTAKGTKIAAAAVNVTETVIGTGIATEEVVANAIETETGELHGDETKIEIATEAIAETVGIATHVIAIVTEAIGEIEGHDRGHRGGRQGDHQGGRHDVRHDVHHGVRHGGRHGGLHGGLRGDLCGALRGGQQGDLPGDPPALLDAVRHVAEAVTKAITTEEKMATNVENAMVVARRVAAVPRQHGSQLSSPSNGVLVKRSKRIKSGSGSKSSSHSSSSSSSTASGEKKKKKKGASDANGDVIEVIEDAKPLPPSTAAVIAAEMEVLAVELSKLGVKELKDLLGDAGVSFAGATEKEDLVRLLTKARAQSKANDVKFVASRQWQRVPDGVALPPGLEVKFDMERGCNYARIPAEKKK
ncbi:hypothetical protein AK812_SmicGene23356 [Symbiodinium microadriaticum]|uniref:SAP domain-containing protein n=1 Tax=Symbiodinium microadriaticum TaxID=2951 RepID=A0A1Q9DHG3_SYMMI|nr:hypothetical protein AK812_SmicGene23356 [Symbiodinium microadriaticum]